MKDKYLISMVLLALTTFKFSALIIPNHPMKGQMVMNHITPRHLTDNQPPVNKNSDTQLVNRTDSNARELHNAKHKSAPYKGFHKVRPLNKEYRKYAK
jgi:hypothetical protein